MNDNTAHNLTVRSNAMLQFGLFDYQKQLALLDKAGDPLTTIDKMINWEQFHSIIGWAREKLKKKIPS